MQIEIQVYLATLDSTGDHFCIIQSGVIECQRYSTQRLCLSRVLLSLEMREKREAAKGRDVT